MRIQIVMAVRNDTGKDVALAGRMLWQTQIRGDRDLRDDDQPGDASPEAAPYAARDPSHQLVVPYHL